MHLRIPTAPGGNVGYVGLTGREAPGIPTKITQGKFRLRSIGEVLGDRHSLYDQNPSGNARASRAAHAPLL